MLQTSYAIWIVIGGFLMIGIVIVRRYAIRHRKMLQYLEKAPTRPILALQRNHDREHRELLAMMVRQTDSVLNGLSLAIAQERKKLNALIHALPINETSGAAASDGEPFAVNAVTAHERILPMARNGETVSAIAQQLRLPEAEVSMVIRLNAA